MTNMAPPSPSRHRLAARDGIGALLICLLVLLAPSTRAATQWPIQAFEVYEGQAGSARQNPLRALANAVVDDVDPDAPMRASVPLTPVLKKAIEGYMGEAARRLQDMGFMPARMGPVRNRADGQKAFRIYYMDFAGPGYARVFYECKEPFRVRMEINAAKLTDKTMPNVITEKGYVDLAHELFHTVQRNSPFFKTTCEPPDWITEGQAEAVGQDLAWQLRQVRREKGQVARWGLRRYQLPLAVVPGPIAHEEAYQTSSFWRYLAERAHAKPAGRLPGPGVGASDYGVDYGYLARFLGDGRSIGGRQGALLFLNRRLMTEPAFASPLAGIYPHFVATLADYGRHRVIGESALTVRHDAWIKNALGECWAGAGTSDTSGFKLDLANPSVSARRVLEPVAAQCVRVHIGAIAASTTLDVRANVASAQIGAQLTLGVAGGKRVAAAVVGTRPGGAGSVVSWTLEVKPGETLDLVIANVAPIPNDTAPVDLALELALPGWQLVGDATAPQAAAQAPPSSANRRPPRPRPPPGSQQTQGSSTTEVERNEDVPQRGCGWPAEDFNGYCGPTLDISLRAVPGSVARSVTVAATGGFMNQMLGNQGQQLGTDGTGSGMPSVAELDGMTIRISVPLPAYGQTPSYANAVIKVDGADWPASGAYGPTDLLSGAQTYFAPSGRVWIDKYTPLELRGRFEAALVALPLPEASKESLPSLPVIKTLRGSFVLTRPFEGEPGFVYLPPDLSSLPADLAHRQPSRPATAEPAKPERPGPVQGPAPGNSATPGSGCDCSCAGYRNAMKLLEALDKPNAGTPGAAPLAAAMCMVSCSSAYQRCEEG